MIIEFLYMFQAHLETARALINQLPLSTICSFDEKGVVRDGIPVVHHVLERRILELFRTILRMSMVNTTARKEQTARFGLGKYLIEAPAADR